VRTGARWTAGVAATLVALVLAGATDAAPVPSSFVAVTTTAHGYAFSMRSAASGAVVQTLGTIGGSFTDNGLALSPNGRDFYFTVVGPAPTRALEIEQLAVASRRRTFVTDGEYPAVSPGGRSLAYVMGLRTLAIRNLRSRRTQSITLGALLGTRDALATAPIAWVDGGADLAVLTGPVPRRVSEAQPRVSGPCASGKRCLVIIRVGRGGIAPQAFVLRSFTGAAVLSGSSADPGSVLLAQSGTSDVTTIDQITPAGAATTVTQLASIPAALPVAFAPGGGSLLYLKGANPPALWTAAVSSTGLVTPTRLVPRARLAGAAW